MSKKKLFEPPVLYDYNGNLEEKWYIHFRCPDPNRNGKMRRKRIYKGLFRIKNLEERYRKGEELCAEYLDMLINGYNPWVNDERVAYIDELDYVYVSGRKGKKALEFKSFNYYASSLILFVEKNHAKKTLETYRSKLRIFREWLERKDYNIYNVTVINNALVVEFCQWLIDERNIHHNTLDKYRSVLHAVFEKAVKDNPGYKNPVFGLPQAKNRTNNAPLALIRSDRKLIMDEIIKDPQLYLMVLFEHDCGMRPHAEVRLMKVGWINFDRGTVTVPAEFNQKGKCEKHATIPDALLDLLIYKFRIHHYPRDYYLLGKNTGGCPGEQHWGKNYFTNHFNKIREKLGLPKDYKLYGMKHTGATQAIDDKISIRALQKQLGHATLESTIKYIETRVVEVNEDYKHNFRSLAEE